MTRDEYLAAILNELTRAEQKIRWWPRDPIHAATILSGEIARLQHACFEWMYEGGSAEHVTKTAMQSAALMLYFLSRIDDLQCRPPEYKKQ